MNKDVNIDTTELDDSTLLGLIKEATELSRISALVNMAYARAKMAEKAKQGYTELSKAIDSKIKAAFGTIKENSRLYDEIQAKKAEIVEVYKTKIANLEKEREERTLELQAKKIKLENENSSLAADSQNLRLDKREKERKYRDDEKQQGSRETAQQIRAKKAEAERLASEGDLAGAKAAIEEYKRLKSDLVTQTTGGMLDIARISQKVRENKEQFKKNRTEIEKIEREIAQIEREAGESIDIKNVLKDKELAKIDRSTSIFKKAAMLASKTLTRVFNKGKAINDEVIAPMKKRIADKIPEVEQRIGSNLSETKEKGKEFFRDKIEKAIVLGRNVRQGAIDKLKARNQRVNDKLQEKRQYLEADMEK